MTGRRYTEQERVEALQLFAVEGSGAVQAKFGISGNTVREWARKYKVTAGTTQVKKLKQANEVLTEQWEQRRKTLVHQMGAVAAKALGVAEASLDGGKLRDAKDATLTMAILIDKAQLLTGGATERTEVMQMERETLERKAAELDELAAQRTRETTVTNPSGAAAAA